MHASSTADERLVAFKLAGAHGLRACSACNLPQPLSSFSSAQRRAGSDMRCRKCCENLQQTLATPRVVQPPPAIPLADQLSRREVAEFLPVLVHRVRVQAVELRIAVAVSVAASGHQYNQPAVVVPRDLTAEQLQAAHFDVLCDLSAPTRDFAWWQPRDQEEAHAIDTSMCCAKGKLFVLVRWASQVQAAADALAAGQSAELGVGDGGRHGSRL